jgi:hypothetical protein
MRMLPYQYTPDNRDFNAQFVANPTPRGRTAPTYSVTLRPIRRFRLPQVLRPQVEVFRRADSGSSWELDSRTTMNERGDSSFALQNLRAPTDGDVFFRIILGDVNLVDSSVMSLGRAATRVQEEASWDVDCNRFRDEFSIPPGRTATDLSVSVVTGWLACSSLSAAQAQMVRWVLLRGGPDGDVVGSGYVRWNGQEDSTLPSSLAAGQYVLRISEGAKSTSATLSYTLR